MFEIHVGENGHVRLTGRLDAAAATQALEALNRIDESLTLDCSQLDYISSAGIGVVIETYKRLHASGRTLRLIHLLPRVRTIFTYTGLDRVLTME